MKILSHPLVTWYAFLHLHSCANVASSETGLKTSPNASHFCAVSVWPTASKWRECVFLGSLKPPANLTHLMFDTCNGRGRNWIIWTLCARSLVLLWSCFIEGLPVLRLVRRCCRGRYRRSSMRSSLRCKPCRHIDPYARIKWHKLKQPQATPVSQRHPIGCRCAQPDKIYVLQVALDYQFILVYSWSLSWILDSNRNHSGLSRWKPKHNLFDWKGGWWLLAA